MTKYCGCDCEICKAMEKIFDEQKEVNKKMNEMYNEDYYERGVETHVSGYTDYKWLPHYVLPLANEIKKRYPFLYGDKVLDYGCAKGFMVKAFHLLGVEAYGFDISKYAVENGEPEIKDRLTNVWNYPDKTFNLIISKDTLEHVPYEDMQPTLMSMKKALNDFGLVFIVVPLGDNGKYRIREYELDTTHVIREDEVWWINQFNKAGFICEEFYYEFPGCKRNWQSVCPIGNGVFVLRKKLYD